MVLPSVEQRRQALGEVLESQAFARSEQLKNFLRFVCELEIAGRAAEIKEYTIGVEALNRDPSYSPTVDSSVRRRAFELRHKLEEAYAGELAASPVLIELPKGSYVPSFRFRGEESQAPPAPRTSPVWFVLALAAGVLLGAGSVYLLRPSAVNRTADDILSEAWGPLATPGGNVLISIASNFHMTVRAAPFSPDSGLPTYPAPVEIYPLFQKYNPLPAGASLYMRPSLNTATLGVVAGVASASATLRSFGARYQVLPERSAPLAGYRSRNVILFGDALTSFAGATLLGRMRLTIAHDPATNRMVIRDRSRPASDPPAFSRHEGRFGGPAEVYGLLTVMPSEGSPGEQHRTLIASGVSHVGIQGVMEYFSSPERLTDLKSRLRKDGFPTFPPAYQLVVRCTAEDSLPLSCGYEAHYVVTR